MSVDTELQIDISINTCPRSLSILSQRSINVLIDTERINSQLNVDWLMITCINQLSMACLQKLVDSLLRCWSNVDQVSTVVVIEYQSRVNWGYQSSVSVNTQLHMPSIVHMIQLFFLIQWLASNFSSPLPYKCYCLPCENFKNFNKVFVQMIRSSFLSP